ncbi:MAG: helix-turn-helix domain-containing protein [Elusimicrobia bacterium]|nr:helix-turn-helix domain-containing protein [Elusimicrobiota bacterium]
MDIYKEIGKRILFARKTLNLTQENIAEAAGIETSFYGQIERGANIPSIFTLSKIAKALNIETSDLFPSSAKRQSPQTKIIINMIEKFSPQNKEFVVDMLMKLSKRLRKY